jgi:hypothetical protein
LDTASTAAVFGRVLGTVLQHQPDGSGPQLGIQLLRKTSTPTPGPPRRLPLHPHLGRARQPPEWLAEQPGVNHLRASVTPRATGEAPVRHHPPRHPVRARADTSWHADRQG